MERICRFLMLLCLLAASNSVSFARAEEAITLSQGQKLYVPAYSHIYAGNREAPVLMAVTLSIRNVDSKHAINITSVEYYGTKGERLKKYIDQTVT